MSNEHFCYAETSPELCSRQHLLPHPDRANHWGGCRSWDLALPRLLELPACPIAPQDHEARALQSVTFHSSPFYPLTQQVQIRRSLSSITFSIYLVHRRLERFQHREERYWGLLQEVSGNVTPLCVASVELERQFKGSPVPGGSLVVHSVLFLHAKNDLPSSAYPLKTWQDAFTVKRGPQNNISHHLTPRQGCAAGCQPAQNHCVQRHFDVNPPMAPQEAIGGAPQRSSLTVCWRTGRRPRCLVRPKPGCVCHRSRHWWLAISQDHLKSGGGRFSITDLGEVVCKIVLGEAKKIWETSLS